MSALLVESLLIAVAVWLAHIVSSDLRDVERVVELVQPVECDGVVARDDDHPKAIQREFVRSRRYSHPLSIVIIALNMPVASEWSLRKPEDIQSVLAHRFLIEQVARIIRREVRRTDYVFRHWDRPNELIVLCPEIDHAHAGRLRNKLARVLLGNGLAARFGNASFPEHALTFDGLLAAASQTMDTSPGTQQVPVEQEREPAFVATFEESVQDSRPPMPARSQVSAVSMNSWSENQHRGYHALDDIRIRPVSPMPVEQNLHSTEATSVD